MILTCKGLYWFTLWWKNNYVRHLHLIPNIGFYKSHQRLSSTKEFMLVVMFFLHNNSIPFNHNRQRSVTTKCSDMQRSLQNCFEWCITMNYLPLDFPYWTAFSSKWWYCGILEAAKSRDGLVVASVGMYCEIARIEKTLTVTRWSFLQEKNDLSYFQNRLNRRRQWWIFSTVPTC